MSTVPTSPLVRVERGQLRPKVLALYEELFSGNLSKSDNYWTEFFLLKCNRPALAATIDALTPERLLACRQVTHDLFVHATEQLKSTHAGTVENTLNILVIYFTVIFSKKFVSYSSDVISVIGGLESIDKIFYRFLEAISNIIGNNKAALTTRVAAVRTVTIIAGCAYQTALVSCFLYRDMFGSIIDFVNSPECELYIGDALSLIGILASYDKLEEINPYHVRLADFVDDSSMQAIARASGNAWEICLDQYINRTETLKRNSSVSGLRSLVYWMGTGSFDTDNHENGKVDVSQPTTELSPHPTISLLLANYEFFNANRVYTRKFLEQQSGPTNHENIHKPPPAVLFISLCSYLLQEQTHSLRAQAYARLSLIVLRNWIENVPQLLLTVPASQFQLANYRVPHILTGHEPHYLLDAIFYCLNICIRFNMKKKLDYDMYIMCLETIYEALDFLVQAHVRFQYQWKDLWRSLIMLTHFMSHHPPESIDTQASRCAEVLMLIVAHCLIYGDSFLCSDDEFDDLYYKVVESSETFQKFIQTYHIENSWPCQAIMTTCTYFTKLIDKKLHNDGSTDTTFPNIGKILTFALNPFSGSDGLDSMQVLETIRDGMKGLSLTEFSKTHKPIVKRYREADERLFLKKVTKIVVQDVTYLYS